LYSYSGAFFSTKRENPEAARHTLEEQLQLHMTQTHKATVPDSTLRVEMNGFEEQADFAKARDIHWQPLS
jgi:hypothetical protein